MSHIIKSNDTLLMLSDDIKYMEKKGISKVFLNELLNQMIPTKDNALLIGYSIKNNGAFPLCFSHETEMIEVSLKKLKKWLDKRVKELSEELSSYDLNSLQGYSLIYGIAHEVEHIYQYLMGRKIIPSPNDVIANAYKGLFDFFKSDSNSLKGKYVSMQYELLLERNAQIECLDLVAKCAKYNGREDLYEVYKNWGNLWKQLGYFDNPNGSIWETYHRLKLIDQYLKFNHEVIMNEGERVRYGFNISPETRELILKK